MGVASAHMTSAPIAEAPSRSLWLRNQKWDLLFISLSVVLVPLPYLFYLLGIRLGLDEDTSRNLINGFVAVAIGGPHMMSTFLRTGLDGDFRTRYPMLIRSSIIIPIVVISLAFLNLTLMLTFFFFWAATHVLHQVTYIVELYNHKEHRFVRPQSAVSFQARMIDYALILTCLFPLASYKIAQDNFWIGQNDLGMVIPDFIKAAWFFYIVAAVFGVALLAFIAKTVKEIRGGYVNWPKTIFIVLTVAVSFTVPALPNMDTAFQGMNTWHSFQYLAITFYIIKIRQQYGDLRGAPLVERFAKSTKDSKGLFLLSTMMLIGSVIVFILVSILVRIVRPDLPADQAHQYFDIPYYTAILSFLWIHYYHDHFLFTNFEALDKAYGDSPA